MFFFGKPSTMPSPTEALPGRPSPIVEPRPHTILTMEMLPNGAAIAWTLWRRMGTGLLCFWPI